MAEEKYTEQELEIAHRGNILMQWQFPEYVKYDRGALWYILAFGIGGGLLIWATLDGNFLFALMIILFAFIIFTHHRADPLDLHFTVYERGLQIGDLFFLYRDIDKFAILYEPPFIKTLYIMPKGAAFRKEIPVPMLDEDPVAIRTMLLDFLTEDLDRDEENYYETMNRIFKLW